MSSFYYLNLYYLYCLSCSLFLFLHVDIQSNLHVDIQSNLHVDIQSNLKRRPDFFAHNFYKAKDLSI